MSLESERRAIGSNNEAHRRGIGQRMINDRADIKAGISAARASTFKADLNALESSPRKQVTLSQREARGSRAATVGTGVYKPPAAPAGIASPFVEADLTQREWWPTGWTSTDGVFEYPAEKRVVMTDDNGAKVEFQYASPQP